MCWLTLLCNSVRGGTTHDTTYSVYAHGIAPASTYSHIVDVVLNSLPCAQNVQAVAKSLPLAPVPLYVVPHSVPCARFGYVVSTAVPCDLISWTWYQSSTISRAYAAAGTGTSDPVPPNQVHNMLYSVRYHLKQTHHYRTMYPREEQVVPMFVPHIHEWSKWYLGSYHVSMIGASGTYDRTM